MNLISSSRGPTPIQRGQTFDFDILAAYDHFQ
jgi:hypothetical protein